MQPCGLSLFSMCSIKIKGKLVTPAREGAISLLQLQGLFWGATFLLDPSLEQAPVEVIYSARMRYMYSE